MRLGRITPPLQHEEVCGQCNTFWPVAQLARSPIDHAWLCPECFEDEANDADVAANEPHCECRGVCPRCTPGV